jgi:hypothetical protein
MNDEVMRYRETAVMNSGEESEANYIENNIIFLTQLAMSRAVAAVDHDKRALTPAKQQELLAARALANSETGLAKVDFDLAA